MDEPEEPDAIDAEVVEDLHPVLAGHGSTGGVPRIQPTPQPVAGGLTIAGARAVPATGPPPTARPSGPTYEQLLAMYEGARRELALTGRTLGSANDLATRMQRVVQDRLLAEELRRVLALVAVEVEANPHVLTDVVLSMTVPAALLEQVRARPVFRALLADMLAARLVSLERLPSGPELIRLEGDPGGKA